MLDELPDLAARIKEFVRNNPLDELARGTSDRLKSTRAHTGGLLVKAAKESRHSLLFEVEDDTLTLAQVKAFENTINLLPIQHLPGVGGGLLRITGFTIQRSFSIRKATEPTMHAQVEYSPLGWPELPDMVTADHNTLFRKPEPSSEPAPLASSGRREFL